MFFPFVPIKPRVESVDSDKSHLVRRADMKSFLLHEKTELARADLTEEMRPQLRTDDDEVWETEGRHGCLYPFVVLAFCHNVLEFVCS